MTIRKLIRNTAFLLVLCLLTGMGLTGPLAYAAGTAGGRHGAYNADEWLPEAALGETRQSGDWLYAVRSGDDYATLVGYTGVSREEISLPSSLDGRDLAAIEPGALADCGAATVHIPGSILRIPETAFGDQRPALCTFSGSAGEAFAISNGLENRSERDYRLVEGVVDLTDAPADRIRRRGDSWVWMNRLEGLRLTAGSVFFYKDSRNIENSYRVLSVEEENGGFLFHVEMPEASEVVVDYTFSNTISLTADDFIPAEGAVFTDGGPGSKDGHTYTKRSKTHYEYFKWKPKINTLTDGGGETKEPEKKNIGEFELVLSGDLEQTVTYNYRYENGQLVQASMVDDSTNTFNIDCKVTGHKKENPFGKPKEDEMNLGHFKVGCTFFQVAGSVDVFFKVTSGITIACTTVSHTNKAYDFSQESWVVVESTRNTYANPNDVSLDPETIENTSESYVTVSAKVEVKAGIKIEIEFIIFDLVTAASIELEGGLKLTLANKDNCLAVSIGPYAKFSFFAGAWHKSNLFNFTIGLKKTVFEIETDFGMKDGIHIYLLADLPDVTSASRVNDPNTCPFHAGKTATVTFDTKTSQHINPLELTRGDPVPWDPSYQLADDPELGRFLGWNLKDNQKESDGQGFQGQNGVEDADVYRANHNLVLHAVWENLNEIIFYEAPGDRREIADKQYVPYGGQIHDPKVESVNGNWIVYWYTLKDGTGNSVTVEFQDKLYTVDDTYELFACRTGSVAPPDGNDPTKFTLIGNTDTFAEYQWVNGSYSIDDYEIEVVTDPVVGSKVAHIKRVKGDPEYLKIPYEIFLRCIVKNAADPMAIPIIYTKYSLTRDDNYTPEEQELIDQYLYDHTEEELQEIFIPVEIDPGAFDSCSRLKVIQLVGRHQLVLGSVLSDIPSLKVVDMRGCLLADQTISDYAFSGCTDLEAIAVNGYVSHIGSYAFQDCSSMDRNLIPESVLTIGSGAYSGCGMRSITIPENVTFIGAYAIDDCESLTDVRICARAFTGMSGLNCSRTQPVNMTLESNVESFPWNMVTFGSNVTLRIREGNLAQLPENRTDNYGYTHIIIEQPFTEIPSYALAYMCSASEIELPDSVQTISPRAFLNSSGLKRIRIPGEVPLIREYTFKGCAGLQEIQWPANLDSIGERAFSECSSLQSVSLPEGLTYLGSEAFNGCTSLTAVRMPDSLKTIGKNVDGYQAPFAGCYNLKTVDLGGDIDYTRRFFMSMHIATGHRLSLDQLTIRETVKSVDLKEFWLWTDGTNTYHPATLKALHLYKNLPDFNREMSSMDDMLEELRMPQFCTYSGGFQVEFTKLKTLIFDDRTTEIYNYYGSWPELETIVLPQNLKTINGCFQNCPKLTNVNFNSLSGVIYSGCFQHCGFDELDLRTKATYRSCFEECDWLTEARVSRATIVGTFARNSRSLRSLYFGEGVTFEEGNGSGSEFRDPLTDEETETWPDLTIMVASENASEIPCSCFHFPNLKTVHLPVGVTALGEGVFHGCERLETVTGLSQTESIGRAAFINCKNLKNLDLTSHLKRIGDSAFENCESLRDMNQFVNLESVGYWAFAGCSSLRSITGFQRINSLNGGVFMNCRSLESVDFGQDHLDVGSHAFMNCVSLKELQGNPEVEAGNEAFYGCTSLRRIRISEQSWSIGARAFYHCSALEELTIPRSTRNDRLYLYGKNTYPEDFSGYKNDNYYESEDSQCINYTSGLKRLVINGPIHTMPGSLTTNSTVLSEIVLNTGIPENAAGVFFSSWTVKDDATGRPLAKPLRIIVNAGENEVADEAFAGMDGFIGEILLDESVETIGSKAFAGNSTLSLVRMGGGVFQIAEDAFEGCGNAAVELMEENAYVQEWCALHQIPCTVNGAETVTLRLVGGGTFCEFFPDSFVREGEDLTASFAWPLTEEPVLPDATREGHVFSGWYFYPQGPWQYHPAGLKPGTTSLYPRWDLDAWQVTLEYGSAAVYPGLKTFMAMAGDLLELSVPERSGDLFTGWYTDAGRTEAFDGVMPASDLILYAGWQKDHGQMSFEDCGDHAELVSCLMDAETPANLVIPASWQGLPVTRIRDNAFAGQKIRTLTLPPMLDQVSSGVFNGVSCLEAIQISPANSLFSSEKGMLLSKDGTELLLTPKNPGPALWIPAGIRRIAAGAGKDLRCSEVILNEGLEEIGSEAFAGGGMKVVRLPDSVASVGAEAYYGCPLETVYTGSGLEEIGADAFEGGNAASFSMYGNVGECAASAYADLHGHPYNYYTLTLMEPRDIYDTNVGSVRQIQAGRRFTPRVSSDLQLVITLKGWMEADQLHYSQPDYMTDFVMPSRNLTLYPDYEMRASLYSSASDEWTIASWPQEDGDVVLPSMLFGKPVTKISSGAFTNVPASVTIPRVMSVSRSAFPSGSKPVIYCHRDLADSIWNYGWDIRVIEGNEGLSFETNGGISVEMILPEDGKVYVSRIPQPVRLGYTFKGWFSNPGLTNPAENLYRTDENGETYINVSIKGMKLYASWEKHEGFIEPDFLFTQAEEGLTVTGPRPGVSELTIPAELQGISIVSISPDAFRGNSDLTGVDMSAVQMTELPDGMFAGCSSLMWVTLPDGMIRIGADAFQGCVSLRNPALPSELRLVGARAFMGAGLTSLHLGASVSQIGEDALLQTAFLEEITVEDGNPYYRAENHALIDLIDARLVKYAGGARADTFTVPEGVYAIGNYALSNSANLKQVILTDQVWELGKGAFSGCTHLESIPEFVSERLTVIPDYCFFNCTHLRDITIPPQVTRIGTAAFGGHTAPGTVTIPDTVETIGSMAFTTENLTIHGTSGSAAEQWAAVRGIPFVDDSLPAFTGFVISADMDTLVPRQRIALRPTAIPEGAAIPVLTWTVSDDSVLQVDQEGMAEALRPGTARVTARTESGLSAELFLTVTWPELREIRLTDSELNTSVGVQRQLDCRKIPQNAAGAIVFSSDNETVATVSGDGTVTGIAEGEATITASCGNLSDTCHVTVFRHVDSLDQPGEKLTMIEGGRVSFMIPEDLEGLKYRYYLTDPSHARVYEYTNQEGILWIHGVSGGTTYLRLEVENGQTAVWEIAVDYALQGISFSYDWPDADDPLSVTPTFTRELKIKTQPTAAMLLGNTVLPEISYRSSDETIATVEPMENPLEGCIVTAVSPGDVSIIAEGTHEWIHGLTAERIITVPEVDVTDMILQPVAELHVGEVYPTELTWEPAYATRTRMTWESGNEEIITVDENGVITAVGPGTTTITVTSPSGLVLTTSITVKNKATAIHLAEHEITLIRGQSQEIQVTFEPEDADEGTDYSCSCDYTGMQAAYFYPYTDETCMITTYHYFGDVTIHVRTPEGLSDSCLVHVVPEKELLEILMDGQETREYEALNSWITIELAMHTTEGDYLDKTVSFVPNDPEAFELQYTAERLNEEGETIRTYYFGLNKIGDFEYSFRTDSGYSITRQVKVRKMAEIVFANLQNYDHLRVGDTVQIEAVIGPEDATHGLEFEYRSDDESVLTVDQNGLVTAVGEGATSISASNGYNSTFVYLFVDRPEATSIRIKPIGPLHLGDMVPVEILTTPEQAIARGLYFRTNPPFIVETDTENRQIHAVDYGYAVLTVESYENPELRDSATLLVIPSEDQIDPGIQLYVNGSTGDFEGEINERMNITVHAPGAARIEILNQNAYWEEMYSFDPATGTGTMEGANYSKEGSFLLIARADYDGNQPLEMRVSNPILMNITSRGAAQEAELEIERETYSRGELICLTIHPVEGMNEYGITVLDEQGAWVDSRSVSPQDMDMTIRLSSHKMAAGVYEIRTYTSGVGYAGTDSAPGKYFITITEETGERPMVFDVRDRDIRSGEEAYFSAWAPGAVNLKVMQRREQDEVYPVIDIDADSFGGSLYLQQEGVYEYWLVAAYSQDGETTQQESEHRTVHVSSYGSTPLQVTVSPRLIPAGSNVIIRAEGFEDTESWRLWIWDNETGETLLSKNSYENAYSPETGFVVDGSLLTEGHRYTIEVSGIRKGYSETTVSLSIVAYPSKDKVMQLPTMLTEIEEEAFVGMQSEVVIIPAGVTWIGHRAFAECYWLKAVVFESAETSWEEDAFENCPDPLLITP